MTNKNLFDFACKNWSEFIDTVTEVSKINEEESLVTNKFPIYYFDNICKSLFPKGNIPSSADGILFKKNNIDLVEFKSGFKQKITKEKFNPDIGKCLETNKICSDYWDLFWENQDRKRSELIESIKLKAIESYILLEKHIFPNCKNNETEKPTKLVFTVVIDEDGTDGIEDTLAELSDSEPNTNNSLVSIRQALKRFTNMKDADGNSYFYDEIRVLTANDFANQIRMAI